MAISFANRVSDARQADPPNAFYGGIIADPMGFGKTLAMISLIASDSQHLANDVSEISGVLSEDSCGLTLIIVPPARRFSHSQSAFQKTVVVSEADAN